MAISYSSLPVRAKIEGWDAGGAVVLLDYGVLTTYYLCLQSLRNASKVLAILLYMSLERPKIASKPLLLPLFCLSAEREWPYYELCSVPGFTFPLNFG